MAHIPPVQYRGAVQTVAPGALGAIKAPALAAHQWADHGDPDPVLQPLQAAGDQGAMGPGAGQGHVEMIAPPLGGKAALPAGSGAAIGGDPVPKLRLLPNEFAIGGIGVIPLVVPAPLDEQAHVEPPEVASAPCRDPRRSVSVQIRILPGPACLIMAPITRFLVNALAPFWAPFFCLDRKTTRLNSSHV